MAAVPQARPPFSVLGVEHWGGVAQVAISFVLLGASLERIDDGLGGVNPWTVAASVALFLLSLAIARMARARAAEPVLERTTDT